MDEQIAQIPSREGEAPFKITSIDKPCFTWYKIFGDLSNGATPLIVLHGGPSAGHGYLLPFATLWTHHKIPVIFYDQIGCGRSTRLPEAVGDEKFWQPSLFITELNNLIDHLQLRSGFHVLGHSWGGMFGSVFAASRPQGLQRLILGSASPSKELYEIGNRLNREQMPQEIQDSINAAIESRDFESDEYKKAYGAWLMKYLFGLNPLPEVIINANKEMEADPTVRISLGGDGPFASNGSIQGFDCTAQLANIAAPTLLYNSEFDVSPDICAQAFFERIPRVRWVKFPNASHMVHLQDEGRQEKVLGLVGDFLAVKAGTA